MGEGQEAPYEEQLRGVFDSFDGSGVGSLSQDELLDLCESLHLQDATPALLQTLLLGPDAPHARVDFEQFKNALILVLSSNIEETPTQEPRPASPEIQPKLVKGSKRYGRRSNPEFIDPASDPTRSSPGPDRDRDRDRDQDETDESAVPCKRERWNVLETSTEEEYEAEGQSLLWNPDEPGTPRGCVGAPVAGRLEQKVLEACEDLALSWDGLATHADLLSLSRRLGLQISGEELQTLSCDALTVQEFVSRVLNQHKPPTPSASPYRQLKRMHSTQPFDEVGRRIATPSALSSSIAQSLFSALDDGTGFCPVENVLDSWTQEGIENGTEILQALNFNVEGKLSLSDLSFALETELLDTRNGVLQAALASFRAEIRHLLACVDRGLREKEKIQSDLEKTERLKTQLATEVDEHHSTIEHNNKLNLRKLEQEHRERLSSLRSELMQEMEQIQVQAAAQRDELQAQVQKIREEESFLRDHLSISVKENRRLEVELLDTAEKLVEAENQITKLQTNMDNIMKEKFGDLDPGSAEFFLQEERIKELHVSYEAQCRELQDRIDELQSELNDFHNIGRVPPTSSKSLSDELETESPGNESDPGLGSEEQPFSLSLEVELMLEQMKEKHLQEKNKLHTHLENKIREFEELAEKQRTSHEEQRAALTRQHQDELQTLREETSRAQTQAQELQRRIEELQTEPPNHERETEQEEEIHTLRQELLEAHLKNADLDEQLRSSEEQQREMSESFKKETEELKQKHNQDISKLEQTGAEMIVRTEEERTALLREFEKEKDDLKTRFEEETRARLDEEQVRFEKEKEEMVQRLTEQWKKERTRLDEQNTEKVQVLLEDEKLRRVREQEEKEKELTERWDTEKTQIQQKYEENLEVKLHQQATEYERKEKELREEWEREKRRLDEEFEEMLQERINEERKRTAAEREEEEERFERRRRMEERHEETVKELIQRHRDERDELHCSLDKLKKDIALERRHVESSFSLRLSEVEERFELDQEAAANRFQDDVLKLEQVYQTELQTVSEKHESEKSRWEEEMKNAADEWLKELQEIENVHKEEMDDVELKNKLLQKELEDFVVSGQTRETELSRQLNELHHRLQESLDTRDQLVSQAQKQLTETEKMLRETVQNLQEERNELWENLSQLESKYNDICSISETQIAERAELSTQRDDLKIKNEELEHLVRNLRGDFEGERKNMQRIIRELEEKGAKWSQIKELEMEVSQVLNFVQNTEIIDNTEIKNVENVNDSYDISSEFGTTITNSTKSSSSLESVDFLRCSAEENETGLIGKNAFSLSRSESCDSGEDKMDESEDKLCEPGQRRTEERLNCEVEMMNVLDPRLTSDQKPQCGETTFENRADAVCFQNDNGFSRLERSEDANVTKAQNSERFCELKPQTVPDSEFEESSQGDLSLYETAVDSHGLENVTNNCIFFMPEISFKSFDHSENQDVIKLKALSKTSTEEHVLLQEKVSLLQQKIEILEVLLAHKNEKLKTGHEVLEENYSLKVKLLFLVEQVKELEREVYRMAELQIRFEDCACENDKLKEQNEELENRVWILESSMNIYGFEDGKFTLTDEINRMREENRRLTELLKELNSPRGNLQTHSRTSPNPSHQLQFDQVHIQEFEDCCADFEKENAKLQRTKTEKRDQIQSKTTNVLRSEASRLSEENLVLKKKIDALKEEELKEMMKTLETLKKEKEASQRAADDFKKQISELQSHSLLLENKNGILCEKNSQHLWDVETLRRQVAALGESRDTTTTTERTNEKTNDRMNETTPDDKTQLSLCVSALEEELNKALNETTTLKQRNTLMCLETNTLREKIKSLESLELQFLNLSEEKKNLVKETQTLCTQLFKAQEKVRSLDESLQTVTLQSSRLKADVRVLQQQKESLQHDVSVLHKKLQISSDKNHVLERALHSTGLQSHSKRLLREELSRLMEQEQKVLKQENEKLQGDVQSIRAELRQARDKIRQLDSTIVNLKQHKQSHSSVLMNLEQENSKLKQELEKNKAHERISGAAGSDLEKILQENEDLKSQMTRLSTQVIQSFQAQLVGLLPPSPHRKPRGQQLGEEPEQDGERKMRAMEERMREIETSLHNVKLLLKEKVAQLKDQLHKNGKADVLIKDLYLENDELLKALEVTEQRHKISEKKNYLLEEKISSLTKILRDLSPSNLPTLQHHFSCS
ncbi:ninein [Boleophthalmus pectinirostris]|uniref:ninein n=1 Tax=Boleophthalmus pectinirostris TaxID=150288 RepID=UPI002431D64E|nr:ninein [Boleophthalmus pectinirostris]